MPHGCDACDHGWRQVASPWVDQELARLVDGGLPDHMVESRRAALSDTWYPCKACQPDAFYRWAQGHWDSDHDAASCEQCKSLGLAPGSIRRSSRSTGPQRMKVEQPTAPVPAPDLEGSIDF